MNRSKLFENLSQLNETEVDIFTYYSGKSIDWFNNLKNSDSYVEDAINLFQSYISDSTPHPFRKIYDKIVKDIYPPSLFNDSILERHCESFNILAKWINKLYVSDKQKDILIILKAIAERDFKHIINYYHLPDNTTFDTFVKNFEHDYLKGIVDWWLEEDDLKTILMFCGYN